MSGRPTYRAVRVVEVVEETPDAHSLVLDDSFSYKPGQFLTFRVPHPSLGTVARSYSLASAPSSAERPKVTVKRVPDGYVSNWLCDHVTAGSMVEILPPAGSFTPASLDRDLLLLAGGSGITPVISILKTALRDGPGQITLVYANRDESAVIFRDELAALAAASPGRLVVQHWLDSAQGYPTAAALAPLVADAAGRDAFICGPEVFMALAEKVLADLGTPPEKIHIERFTVDADSTAVSDSPDSGPATRVEVFLDGTTHHLEWPAHKRLLDVFIDAGINPPYSCRQGNCGACMLRILDGEVSLANNEILEAEDFAEHWTLACQATPVTDRARFTYEAD